ncbi:MAG: zinc ribbon domain-containing protein [Gemmatimonadota bacterium]
MTSVTPQTLARFHAALVHELSLRRDGNLDAPFTVAEIYQHLVPYRTHRDAIGVEINGDYEDALLRLLAGEGGYLRLESDPVRKELQDELKRSNPNTGLFREFAALEVRMNPASVGSGARSVTAPDGSQGSEPALELELPQSGRATGSDAPAHTGQPAPPRKADSSQKAGSLQDPGFPSESESPESPGMKTAGIPVASAPAPGSAQPAPSRATQSNTSQGDRAMEGPDAKLRLSGSPTDAGGPATGDGTPSHCPDCSKPLPPRASLRFCPFCGVNVRVVPCGECGEELERSWSYCVACGTAA